MGTPESISLGIIIPTLGRPSLDATLQSILAAGYRAGDSVYVVGDGEQPEARKIILSFNSRMNLSYQETPAIRRKGHVQRNLATKIAEGSHLCYIDDDDVYVQGAFDIVREVVSRSQDKLHMFRMRGMVPRLGYDVLWSDRQIRVGNVGTPMFVVPNMKMMLGQWGPDACGDFHFILQTVANFGGADAVVWREEIISEIH